MKRISLYFQAWSLLWRLKLSIVNCVKSLLAMLVVQNIIYRVNTITRNILWVLLLNLHLSLILVYINYHVVIYCGVPERLGLQWIQLTWSLQMGPARNFDKLKDGVHFGMGKGRLDIKMKQTWIARHDTMYSNIGKILEAIFITCCTKGKFYSYY